MTMLNLIFSYDDSQFSNDSQNTKTLNKNDYAKSNFLV